MPLKRPKEVPGEIAVPAVLNLDAWLDSNSAPQWRVPGPFDVRGARLIGSESSPSWVAISEHPWLATELADVSAGLDNESEARTPSLAVVKAAVGFADRYGLTASRPRDPFAAPALKMPLAELLAQSWNTRQVLVEYRDLSAPPSGPLAKAQVRDVIGGAGPLGRFFGETTQLMGFRVRPFGHGLEAGLHPRAELTTKGEGGLFDIIRLQLLADFLAARPVSACDRCGKLFIWSKGRATPARSAGLRGRPPTFCSYSHAQSESRERLRKKKEG